MPQAREIYQEALDAMTQAMRTRDVSAFLRCIRLPLTMTTADAEAVFDSAPSLSARFSTYLDELETRGVERIERTCIAARFNSCGVIEGHHSTRLYKDAGFAVKPFTTLLKFARSPGGAWLNYRSETGLANSSWPILPADVISTPPRGVARDDIEAFGIFQKMLNTVTQHYLNGDVVGLDKQVLYPVRLHSRIGDSICRNFDELKVDFAQYMKEFESHNVTDVVRTVKTAEFRSDREIWGRYRTYVLSKDIIIVDPYDSEVELELAEDETWRLRSVRHGLGHMRWREEGDET
ncbi:hypothetical protein ACN2XU_06725 [Primorskyibacter sp. 2E107]|uniref:hypothetical protein n=1 Tax=Primorskyibacter sp. 2E107 TaxID=3403458 RepID=UPI003AF51513